MKNIKLHHLSYFYDHRKSDGVDKINLTLSAGELCSVIGPSGSGKTTLLKLISNQLTPQRGTIELPLNATIGYYTPSETPWDIIHNTKMITLMDYLKEDTTLSEDTIRDQVSFLELSDDLQTQLIHLSTGQWHRAQMAKFFFKDHQVLLLDEPFVYLDPNRRQFIAESLLRLAKENNKIVLWITHFIEDALLLSDKILLLQYGVQQQFSTPIDLYWKPENLFSALYLGPNNLILGVPTENETFNTVLGTIKAPSTNQGLNENASLKEVLLMCRPHLCSVHLLPQHENSLSPFTQWKMTLKKVSFLGSIQRLEFTSGLRPWWVDLPALTSNDSRNLKFEIDNDYWITIPNQSWVILPTY